MKIELRALEPGDIDAIYRWENDPQIWVYNAAHQPFSRHALLQYIDESSLTDIYASRQLRLVAEKEGKPVGCIDLYDFEPFHRRAAIGVLVDSSERQQGIGRAMLEQLENFAREHLQLHQLYCTIATDNHPCLGLFRSANYQQSGTLSQWIMHQGIWVDAIVFQKIIK